MNYTEERYCTEKKKGSYRPEKVPQLPFLIIF